MKKYLLFKHVNLTTANLMLPNSKVTFFVVMYEQYSIAMKTEILLSFSGV
jgi:hypothetical protein